jgi:outer membrane protein TolC
MKKTAGTLLVFIFLATAALHGESVRQLSMKEFITLSAKNDPYFQRTLIDALYLRYKKDLQLPVSDLIASLSGEYGLLLDPAPSQKPGDYSAALTLSKLFPYTGTEVSAGYQKTEDYTLSSYRYTSSLSFQISQSIARNAFGGNTRLLDKKIEAENQLIRYQVVEAYEDYMASLMKLYLQWYSQKKQLEVAKSVHEDNTQLYEMAKQKVRFKVALPQEADKVYLELLISRENILALEEKLKTLEQSIFSATGISAGENGLSPALPSLPVESIPKDRAQLLKSISGTRTFFMLSVLEKQGLFALDIARNELLPSAKLFAGYGMLGQSYDLTNPEHQIYGGVTVDFNFGRQAEKANYESAKLDTLKNRFEREHTLLTLKNDIIRLASGIESQKKLIRIAEEKTEVSKSILEAEKKNYQIGKTSLNDLILAKKNAYESIYDQLEREVTLFVQVVEWKRVTDRLVEKNDIYGD